MNQAAGKMASGSETVRDSAVELTRLAAQLKDAAGSFTV